MSLAFIHGRLAETAALFIAVLGIWALFSRIRSQPLSGGWFGAAVIAEVLLVAQVTMGAMLYLNGHGDLLPRPFIHILYGITAVITLPSAYGYFSRMEDDHVLSLGMAFVCLFLWGLVQRAASTAVYLPPGL